MIALNLKQGRYRLILFVKSLNMLGSHYLQINVHMVDIYLSFQVSILPHICHNSAKSPAKVMVNNHDLRGFLPF